MITLEEAQATILGVTNYLHARPMPVADAVGHVILDALLSPIDLPPFDNSSMDGYAVRAADLAKAGASAPVTLRIASKLPAGTGAAQPVEPGTCARIFTGSMLPPGADAVVMQEEVKVESAAAVFAEPAAPHENVRFKGEDLKAGTPVTCLPVVLTPQRAALLAAVGIASIRATPKPVVGLIATGSELREPGQPLGPGQIYESNRTMLAALASQFQAHPKIYPLLPDDLSATKAALATAFAECDAVVTTGGVSVGEMDFVKAAFTELGGQIDFWKVAIRPGKPFVFGRLNNKLLFGLPGNPVSAFVTFLLLVAPALLKMRGFSDPILPVKTATLAEPFVNKTDRRHFARALVDYKNQARLSGPQASHRLLSLADCNGLIDVPPRTTLSAGATVTALTW